MPYTGGTPPTTPPTTDRPPTEGCGVDGTDCCDGGVCEDRSICNTGQNLQNDPTLGMCVACGGVAGDRNGQRACGGAQLIHAEDISAVLSLPYSWYSCSVNLFSFPGAWPSTNSGCGGCSGDLLAAELHMCASRRPRRRFLFLQL